MCSIKHVNTSISSPTHLITPKQCRCRQHTRVIKHITNQHHNASTHQYSTATYRCQHIKNIIYIDTPSHQHITHRTPCQSTDYHQKDNTSTNQPINSGSDLSKTLRSRQKYTFQNAKSMLLGPLGE